MPLELVLIRHGETTWNRRRVLQGHTDVPLSEVGLEQARRLVRGVEGLRPPTVLFSSDLQRARKTAEPIAAALGVAITERFSLRERCFGAFEGCPWEDIQQRLREAAIQAGLDDHNFRPPGGESRADVEQRLGQLLAEIDAFSEDDSVWVVSHGGVVRNLLRMLVGEHAAHLTTGFTIPNASVSILQRGPVGWSPVRLVDTRHLREVDPAAALDEAAAVEAVEADSARARLEAPAVSQEP